MGIERQIDRTTRPSLRGREPRSRERLYTGGATVGDGLKTTARIAGVTTILSMLFNAGPMLLAGLAGCLFMLRGCLMSPSTPSPPPAAQRMASFAQTQIQPPATSNMPAPHRLAVSRERQATLETHPTMPLGAPIEPPYVEQRSNTQNLDAQFQTPYYTAAIPLGATLSSDPSLSLGGGFGQWPAPNMTSGFAPGFFVSPSNPMLNALSAPPMSNEPPAFEISPLFNFQRGRKFAGTSQMPGEPSRRISLSIEAIRESGRDITAKLSTLDGRRFTRPYTGLIEKNPLRLKLIPVRDPTSFGTFVTFQPWYSNSPMDITLEISSDGKSLSGTSSSSEEFELLPLFELSPAVPPVNQSEAGDQFAGLDDSAEGGSQWKLVRRNAANIDASAAQVWKFTRISDGGGSFAWTKGEARLASGTYLENAPLGQLDIVLMDGQEPRIYRGLVDRESNADDGIRVCIPLEPGGKRPARVAEKYGNVFDLVRLEPGRIR